MAVLDCDGLPYEERATQTYNQYTRMTAYKCNKCGEISYRLYSICPYCNIKWRN